MEGSEQNGAAQCADPPGPSSSSCNIMSRMALNDNKAGMEGLDKERINQIIYEASKDSKFFENEKKKEEQLESRIKEQQLKMSKINQAQLLAAEQEADKALAMLEEERDLSHTIVHVDMDAFYAAVEMRDDPTLRNKPMAVGGMGMLSTSNYLARRFGVRAAMPGFIGLKLCPDLVMVKPNFEKYTAVSRDIREIMSQYDPDFCPMSLDEAYLDLTIHLQQRLQSSPLSRMFLLRDQALEIQESSCRCDLNSVLRPALMCCSEIRDHGSSDEALQTFLNTSKYSTPTNVCDKCKKVFPSYTCKVFGYSVDDAVLELRNRIEQRTHLTASAGIAPNTMLAKVCSDKNKPNGQYCIKPDKREIMSFILELPIRKISGIGKVTEKLLGSLGVANCKDLFTQRALLYHLFSSTSFNHFMRISAGIGSTCVERDGERKSISTERTFSEISKPKLLHQKCQELCQNLSEDMKDGRTLGKTVTLKLKTVGFEVKTRSCTLAHYTNEETTILKAAQMLLQTEIDAVLPDSLRLRLLGVRMSKLCPEQEGQVSVAEMFKRMDKSDQETHNSVDSSNPEDPYLKNRINVYSNSSNASTIADRNVMHQEDSEDEETAEFSLPLEPIRASELDGTESRRCSPEKSPSKEKRKNVFSSSGEIGMLKYLNRVDRNSDNKLHIPEKCGKDLEAQTQAETCIAADSRGDCSVSVHNALFEEKEIKVTSRGHHVSNHEVLLMDKNCFLTPDDQAQSSTHILNQNSDSTPETGMVSCPVCRQQKLNWPLDQLNTHIDLCLSKQAVKDILQEQRGNDKLPTAQKNKSTKRPAVTSNSSSLKVHKKQKSQPSLISYFKP